MNGGKPKMENIENSSPRTVMTSWRVGVDQLCLLVFCAAWHRQALGFHENGRLREIGWHTGGHMYHDVFRFNNTRKTRQVVGRVFSPVLASCVPRVHGNNGFFA